MNGLAICAGIGGLELGIGIAVGESYRCVGYLERDSYAAAVLVARMEDASLDQAPIWDDLTTFDGQRWRGVVDLISAGFPCQPWSVAGKQRGIEDARWIWPEIVRIVRDVEPGFVFLENVPGLIRHGLPRVLGDLAELGFDAEWMCLAASDMGAPHVRERLFILAHSGRGAVRLDDWTEWGAGSAAGSDGKAVADAWRVGYRDVQSANDGKSGGQSVSDAAFRQARDAGDRREASGVLADAERPERRAREPGGDIADRDDAGRGEETDRAGRDCQEVGDSSGNGLSLGQLDCGRQAPFPAAWPPGPQGDWTGIEAELEPAVCRMAHGPSARMDRLRCLGNGVVPIVAANAIRILAGRFVVKTIDTPGAAG